MTNKTAQDQRGQLEKFFHRGLLTLRLLFDGRVDTAYKLIPLMAILYVLSPIDLIPELAFGPLGVFDDLGVLLLGMEAFIRLAPSGVVQEYNGNGPTNSSRTSSREDVIEGEYIVRD